MSKVDCDAIILGGGHNGLVAAAYLARAGLDVLLKASFLLLRWTILLTNRDSVVLVFSSKPE